MSNEVIIQFEWNWQKAKPVFKALMPISAGRSYPGEFLCVDLSCDPADYGSLTAEELVQEITIGPKPRPICPVRLNGVPIVFAVDEPLVSAVLPDSITTLLSRARRLHADPGLLDRMLTAADLRRSEFSEPEHPEQQLYSGGFITDADMNVLNVFHACDDLGRMHAVERIRDKRLQYLAARLMYEESPWVLPAPMRLQIDAELNRRLHAGLNAPWTTFATAQRDIEKMLPDADLKRREILLEYRDYITLASSIPDAAE